jgi:LPPG:FO 2-phospho-L-lactate transferase
VRVSDPRGVVVIGNTADDEEFFGLHVSPDLDTLTYTLANLAEPRRGWGVAGDTFMCLEALARFYGEMWFRLGDRDLATHVYRSDRLRAGEPLSRITRRIAHRLGVTTKIIPMTDDVVRTFVHTTRGRRAFQIYLVRDGCVGRVKRIEFQGIRTARPGPGVLAALAAAKFVIIPPSNPIVSIAPILSLQGVRKQLRDGRAPVAAISPLIGGRPVKGPADRMLRGLGIEPSPVGVAGLYADFIDLFVLDSTDAALAPRVAEVGCRVLVADTLLSTPLRATRLARRVLKELSTIRRRPRSRQTGEASVALSRRQHGPAGSRHGVRRGSRRKVPGAGTQGS